MSDQGRDKKVWRPIVWEGLSGRCRRACRVGETADDSSRSPHLFWDALSTTVIAVQYLFCLTQLMPSSDNASPTTACSSTKAWLTSMPPVLQHQVCPAGRKALLSLPRDFADPPPTEDAACPIILQD